MDYRKIIQEQLAKLHTANGMKANPLLDSDLGADIVADICRIVVNKNCNTPLVSESVEPVCEVMVCPECDIEYWYNNRYGEYEPQCDCFKRQTER